MWLQFLETPKKPKFWIINSCSVVLLPIVSTSQKPVAFKAVEVSAKEESDEHMPAVSLTQFISVAKFTIKASLSR
jgi:hypothetical protein